ncbi:hypothetical protein EYF80_006212 [Liparis tanakae]|uniref:Uncharacterized protein n=1 Tax=Liparis tanakae TaxID=230148 RepID=A0A4Z2J1K8_9TELE|nr:hypothetical protein EYF80_006212 [Liparis tanakae]
MAARYRESFISFFLFFFSALTFASLPRYILVLPSAMLYHLSITRSQRATCRVALPSAEMAESMGLLLGKSE